MNKSWEKSKQSSSATPDGALTRRLADRTEDPAGTDRLSEADAAIRAVSKPTVALVRGVCMGGGWQVAAACDVVLAADDARVAITPAKLGILYPPVGLERLVGRVGRAPGEVGAEVSPAQAAAWGLVTDVLPADGFEDAARSFLGAVASRSRFSVHTMKALIDAPAGPGLDAAWGAAWREFPFNEDLAAERAAFAAGRRPVFTWVPPGGAGVGAGSEALPLQPDQSRVRAFLVPVGRLACGLAVFSRRSCRGVPTI